VVCSNLTFEPSFTDNGSLRRGRLERPLDFTVFLDNDCFFRLSSYSSTLCRNKIKGEHNRLNCQPSIGMEIICYNVHSPKYTRAMSATTGQAVL
jgi:hypothetical protein